MRNGKQQTKRNAHATLDQGSAIPRWQPARDGLLHLVSGATARQRRYHSRPVDGNRPVIIFGAHPDDAALGAGGLAAIMTRQSLPVIIVTATTGALGGNPVLRKAEDSNSARILGAELLSGKLRDGHLSLHGAIRLVESVIKEFNPEVILAPYEDDTHQDHRNLALAVASVARRVPNLLYYEGPTSRDFFPSVVVDISAVWQQKWDAIVAHASQMSRTNLLFWTDFISKCRAWPRYCGSRCEGFRLAHGDLLSLARVFSATQYEVPPVIGMVDIAEAHHGN
ncbi:MAG: PIG-L family deacetylase [Bryobacteraceae bacterium]|jgi:LmbE family N-acetylglucosaminyl deacetylase